MKRRTFTEKCTTVYDETLALGLWQVTWLQLFPPWPLQTRPRRRPVDSSFRGQSVLWWQSVHGCAGRGKGGGGVRVQCMRLGRRPGGLKGVLSFLHLEKSSYHLIRLSLTFCFEELAMSLLLPCESVVLFPLVVGQSLRMATGVKTQKSQKAEVHLTRNWICFSFVFSRCEMNVSRGKRACSWSLGSTGMILNTQSSNESKSTCVNQMGL